MFQGENHFINKRLQKPTRLNLKFVSAVNNDNKTKGNSVFPTLSKNFYCQLKQLALTVIYQTL
jgi:hypothetical protein